MRHIPGVACIAVGMLGLYFNVEYSGWVVFVGCVTVASS
jgi:hypothetical protein